MSRKQSRAELEAAYAQSSQQQHLLYRALRAVMAGEAKLIGQFTSDGITVRLRLYDPTGATNGCVIVTQHFQTEQDPDHQVFVLDDYARRCSAHVGHSEFDTQMSTLLSRAQQVRNESNRNQDA